MTQRHPASPGLSAHKDGVRCASWFGLDTGMFATGGGDAVVTVWDTNAMARACSFDVEDAVYDVQFHPWAASHALVASARPHTASPPRHSAHTPRHQALAAAPSSACATCAPGRPCTC